MEIQQSSGVFLSKFFHVPQMSEIFAQIIKQINA